MSGHIVCSRFFIFSDRINQAGIKLIGSCSRIRKELLITDTREKLGIRIIASSTSGAGGSDLTWIGDSDSHRPGRRYLSSDRAA